MCYNRYGGDMYYFAICTVAAIFLGIMDAKMLPSILATYIFCMLKFSRRNKIIYFFEFLSIALIFYFKDYYTGALFVLGSATMYPVAIAVGVICVILSKEKNVFFIIIISAFVSAISNKLFVLQSRVKNYQTEKDEDNLYLRTLRENERLEKKALAERIKHEERSEMLMSLHHLIGHTITSAILSLKAMEITGDYSEIGDLRGRLERGLTEIRKTLHNLNDENIDFNIEAEKYKEQLKKSGINFTYDVNEKTMDSTSKKELLEILKEGVTNVIRHSNSKNAHLELIENKGFYRFSLASDGIAEANFKKGLGLLAMENFAHKRNGYFDVDTSNGFRVIITYTKEAFGGD